VASIDDNPGVREPLRETLAQSLIGSFVVTDSPDEITAAAMTIATRPEAEVLRVTADLDVLAGAPGISR